MLKYINQDYIDYFFRSDGKVLRRVDESLVHPDSKGYFRLKNEELKIKSFKPEEIRGMVMRHFNQYDARKTLPEPFTEYEMDGTLKIYNKKYPEKPLLPNNHYVIILGTRVDSIRMYCELFQESTIKDGKLIFQLPRSVNFGPVTNMGMGYYRPSTVIMRIVRKDIPDNATLIPMNPDYLYANGLVYHYKVPHVYEPNSTTLDGEQCFTIPLTRKDEYGNIYFIDGHLPPSEFG